MREDENLKIKVYCTSSNEDGIIGSTKALLFEKHVKPKELSAVDAFERFHKKVKDTRNEYLILFFFIQNIANSRYKIESSATKKHLKIPNLLKPT